MKHIGIVNITTAGTCLCVNELVNETIRRGLGDDHPEFTLHGFPFIKYLNTAFNDKNWQATAEIVTESINKLKKCGTDFIIIPCNTIHYCISTIQLRSPLPVLDLVDLTVKECLRRGFKKVGVLGTKLTIKDRLFNAKLEHCGITPIIPAQEICDQTQCLIEEIIEGKVNSIEHLIVDIKSLNCDALILGCTELPTVLNEKNLGIPVIDTTRLLAHKALDYAMN